MDWFQTLITAFIGAISGFLPVYIKFRNFQSKMADKDIDLDTKRAEQKKTNQINTEAEWKRILEYRDAELQMLRARDEAQDKQIKDLFDKHMDCERDKAINTTRLEYIDTYHKERSERLEAKIRELQSLLEGKVNVPKGTPDSSGTPSSPVLDQSGH